MEGAEGRRGDEGNMIKKKKQKKMRSRGARTQDTEFKRESLTPTTLSNINPFQGLKLHISQDSFKAVTAPHLPGTRSGVAPQK